MNLSFLTFVILLITLGIFTNSFQLSASKERKNYHNSSLIEESCEKKETDITFSQLFTPELVKELKSRQKELFNKGFSSLDLKYILYFIDRYKDESVYVFLKDHSLDFLHLSQSLDLPVLEGDNCPALKKSLMQHIFTKETLALTKHPSEIHQFIEHLDKDFSKKILGKNAKNQDLEIFSSPSGQLSFYWMRKAFELHLTSVNPHKEAGFLGNRPLYDIY
jgi:hypothetical protein